MPLSRVGWCVFAGRECVYPTIYLYVCIIDRLPANYLRFYEVLILCRTFNSPTLPWLP